MSSRISALSLFLAMAGFLVPWWQECVRAETKVVGSFDEVIADAAVEVLKITANQPVIVGQFTPSFLPDSNSGPAIAELLKKAAGKRSRETRRPLRGQGRLRRAQGRPEPGRPEAR